MQELQYGVQPFWFWNGEMKEDEILRQLDEMNEKGIRGFLIHPRQGMELPYLSKAYFEAVEKVVQAAKARNMEVWIYDEYPYPSGVSGGEVILDHPEYMCKRLERVVKEVNGTSHVRLEAPWGRVILARAYPVRDGVCDFEEYIDLSDCVGTGYRQEVFQYSGLTQYNKKRYFKGDAVKLLQWEAPEGAWKVYFVTETLFRHFKYFENFVDPLKPEAVKYFLETTHERYKKYVGEEFGKTIKGFFSDEVTPFPESQPWSPQLPEWVKERHGIDLLHYLPALWEDIGEMTSMVRYAYWDTVTEQFIESYDKTIYNWCEENHLMYIGEKPILRSKELQYVHIPGIDSGHQKVGSKAKVVSGKYRANGKMPASAAHFYQKPSALCEAGHSIGWGMTIQDMKWIFDWLAVQGIDFFIIHGFFYTTDGLKKHDAPPSAFFQMPWWKDAEALSNYGRGLGELLRDSSRKVSILLVDPVTSIWTLTREQKQDKLEAFALLQNTMLEQQMDYYIVDPELLAEAVVEKMSPSENETEAFSKTVLRIGQDVYDIVVLPEMTSLEKGACERLGEFVAAGGNVCAVNSFPYERIEEGDALERLQGIWEQNAENNAHMAYGVEALLQWLRSKHQPDITILAEDAEDLEGILSYQGVLKSQKDYIFIVNTSSRMREIGLVDKAGNALRLSLEPYESRVVFAEELAVQSPAKEELPQITLELKQMMSVKPTNLNALRLGEWNAILPGGQERRVECAPVIDQMESGEFLLPVQQKKYFGCPKELDFPMVELTYVTEFLCDGIDCSKEIYLVMEPETFLGDWEIYINQKPVCEKDFKTKEIYLPTNQAALIQDYLQQGINQVRVKVRTRVSYGGMRNPLYLFGDFGVEKTENYWKLLPFQGRGQITKLPAAGLPFYYGELVFSTELPDDVSWDKEVCIKIEEPELADSIRLKIGDWVTPPASYRPYQFRIPGGSVPLKQKKVDILLQTTAIGLFEGEYFNREKHTYEKCGLS